MLILLRFGDYHFIGKVAMKFIFQHYCDKQTNKVCANKVCYAMIKVKRTKNKYKSTFIKLHLNYITLNVCVNSGRDEKNVEFMRFTRIHDFRLKLV